MGERLSYKEAGVDIDAADAAKMRMAEAVETNDPRVLNRLGAFASHFDGRFSGYEHPVLVLKIEDLPRCHHDAIRPPRGESSGQAGWAGPQ